MDVGQTNGWQHVEVVSGAEILAVLSTEFSLTLRDPAYRGEVALHWRHSDGVGEIGLIQSVTQPFFFDCQRIRLSANGKVFTCLFAADGHDLLGILRNGGSVTTLSEAVRSIWLARQDRYSEVRGQLSSPKAEMSYLGG